MLVFRNISLRTHISTQPTLLVKVSSKYFVRQQKPFLVLYHNSVWQTNTIIHTGGTQGSRRRGRKTKLEMIQMCKTKGNFGHLTNKSRKQKRGRWKIASMEGDRNNIQQWRKGESMTGVFPEKSVMCGRMMTLVEVAWRAAVCRGWKWGITTGFWANGSI